MALSYTGRARLARVECWPVVCGAIVCASGLRRYSEVTMSHSKVSSSNSAAASPPRGGLRLPAAPYLVVGHKQAVWHDPSGEVLELTHRDAAERARQESPILCHARATARRLGSDPFPAFDLLELYAFVRPASFVAPTPRGLADHFGFPEPRSLDQSADVLRQVTVSLLSEMAARGPHRDPQALGLAWLLARAGWPWGASLLSALGVYQEDADASARNGNAAGLRVWDRLPEWSDQPPPDPAGAGAINPDDARARLTELLDSDSEVRSGQADYASSVTEAFRPGEHEGSPHVVLAQAGTGIGKTLGYLTPASLWAEANQAPVWISTYTRNLQHQIDRELARLYPEPTEKAERVVIRKGRENYLCLLNLQDAVSALGQRPQDALAMVLLARWAERSRDGDMVGGDFPGWLADILGRPRTLGLTDRRGECIYSACQHYSKCFIERGIRQARHARFVIANHALVMVRAALGDGEDGGLASHYVFDEGHHLFDAADSAFSAHLTGSEAFELRRWILGSETGRARNSRLRGLKRRIEDLVTGQEDLSRALEESLSAARVLAAEGWPQRLRDGSPRGPCERFLAALRAQVYARAQSRDGPYSLETEPRPATDEVAETAADLKAALERLRVPLTELATGLTKLLDEASDRLDSDSRRRIDATRRGVERRARRELAAWCDMLEQLTRDAPPEVVDWFGVERIDGRDIDLGFYRHWIDPTVPFAEVVLRQTQGDVITSATLTDKSGEPDRDWQAAEVRSGAVHLDRPALRCSIASPFDYGAQTRVMIVNDVRKDDLDQVAAAYRELFAAAGGGALGLFTAISRLRAVHERIAVPLEDTGLPLYAQHVDRLDTTTLIEIFRVERDSCLLGTDAVRDGIDVPGEALRLIVFDRVPWPRPDIRHKARRAAFGGRHYDDRLTRLRLQQAFGRLVRRAEDRGVFVLLDSMMPSRLLGAFPEGVDAQRIGLAEAVSQTSDFLSPPAKT